VLELRGAQDATGRGDSRGEELGHGVGRLY
jgi:hypothetical protein